MLLVFVGFGSYWFYWIIGLVFSGIGYVLIVLLHKDAAVLPVQKASFGKMHKLFVQMVISAVHCIAYGTIYPPKAGCHYNQC
jgi:hypothetical protein